MRHTAMVIMILALLSLGGCFSSGGTEVTNPPRPTTTKLISSSLADALSLSTLSLPSLVSSDCLTTVTQCVTPSNLSGKVYYAGLGVGTGDSYSLGPIIGSITDPSVATSFPQEDLQDFDLTEELSLEGNISCCGGVPYPRDEEAIVRTVHIFFAYADAVLTLTSEDGVSGDLVGTHTIRTVFGDIDGTDFKKGDLLYKGEGDTAFVWCTSEGGCIHAERPENPIQEPVIASYDSPERVGNQTIPSFFANLPENHEEIRITEEQAKNNSFAITIDFDMTNGVGFTSNLSPLTRVEEMVGVFRLVASPQDQDNSFTATIQVELE